MKNMMHCYLHKVKESVNEGTSAETIKAKITKEIEAKGPKEERGKLCDKYRNELSWNGYTLDVLKYGLQKYIRQ